MLGISGTEEVAIFTSVYNIRGAKKVRVVGGGFIATYFKERWIDGIRASISKIQ